MTRRRRRLNDNECERQRRYASFFFKLAAIAASRAATALADDAVDGGFAAGTAGTAGTAGADVVPIPGIPRELNPACAHTLSIYLNALSAKNFSVFIAAEHVARNAHRARAAARPVVVVAFGAPNA